jgi:hypothetical protein
VLGRAPADGLLSGFAGKGESVEIEPFEEIRLLRWTRVSVGTMALVSWRDALYVVAKDDLEERTMRVFRAGR